MSPNDAGIHGSSSPAFGSSHGTVRPWATIGALTLASVVAIIAFQQCALQDGPGAVVASENQGLDSCTPSTSQLGPLRTKALNMNLNPGATTKEFNDKWGWVRELGAGMVRNDFNWADIERTPGVYDWSFYDRWVLEAYRSQVLILAIITTTPSWAARNPGDRLSRPSNLGDYQRFVRALVQRYQVGGALAQEQGWGRSFGIFAWEIWNEPNLQKFWPGGVDANEYAQMLRAANTSIRQLDPSAAIFLGGLSPISVGPDAGRADLAFIRSLYSLGVKPCFDAMNLHIYIGENPPDWMRATSIEPVRAEMLVQSDPVKPIYVTEIGYETRGSISLEAQQARYLVAAFEELAKGYFSGFFWFNLKDFDNANESLGLLRLDDTKKPAFDSFRTYRF